MKIGEQNMCSNLLRKPVVDLNSKPPHMHGNILVANLQNHDFQFEDRLYI